MLDPLSQQAVAERILALVTPEPRSQRILRRALRSAQRLGSEIDALWVAQPGRELSRAGGRSRSRRCAGSRAMLGAHFIEVEGDNLVAAVKRVVGRARLDVRASSARPTSRAAPRSCAGRSSRRSSASLPGIDIRVVADRACAWSRER